MNSAASSKKFVIAASHPALPGHFPGHPVVPGVILLDHVAAAIERGVQGARIAGFAQVKFLHPLLPEQSAELIIDSGPALRFRIVAGTQLLATGSVELRT